MTALVATMVVAALLVVGAPAPAEAAANACRDTAACCQIFDFSRPSAWNASGYGDIATLAVAAGADGPWAAQGIGITVEQKSPLSGLAYPLGLVNTSKPTPGPSGAERLYRAGTGLSLGAFEYFSTTMLRYSSTLHWAIAKQPACVASVTTLRSVDFNHRQSVRLTSFRLDALSGTLGQVEQHSAVWATTDTRPDNTFELTSLHVDELRLEFYGQGYGAVSRVEVCYHAPLAVDRCGVCAGPGLGCDVVGGACNTGMLGACGSGTFDANMVCVPNLATAVELCNGLDDNCDGLVDNAAWPTVECGTGACWRSFSTCIGGRENLRCVPGSPTVEVCNGIDDDCDGVIDNGGVCGSSASGTAQPTPSASATPAATPPPSATPSTPPSPSAPATPAATASASASPTHSRSATATPSLGATPSPSRTPSHAPTRSPAPVGGGGLLVPLLTCVRPLDTAPGEWQAVFGYALTGGNGSNVALAAGADTNWLLSPWLANQPQPTLFRANTQMARAFEMVFTADDELQWRLCLDGACRTAVATAASVRCDLAPAAMEPVQPVASGCVSRIAGQCTASWGYVNPNAFTAEMEPGVAGVNAFAPAPADRRQPRLFWPGYVADAFTTTFECAAANWTMAWTLGGAVVTRDRSHLC